MPRCFFFIGALMLCVTARAQLPKAAAARALSLPKRTESTVFRANIKPVWQPDSRQLWYRVQTGREKHEWVLIQLPTGTRTTAASLRDLGLPAATVLRSADLKVEPRATRRTGPASVVHFVNGMDAPADLFWINTHGTRVNYGRVPPHGDREIRTFEGHVWLITTRAGEPLAVAEATAADLKVVINGKGISSAPVRPSAPQTQTTSPDGRWIAAIREGHVDLIDTRSGSTKALPTPLDGQSPFTGAPAWAPDSSCFVVANTPVVPDRHITLIESSPAKAVQPIRREIPYPKPGDPLPKPRPVLFSVPDGKPLMVDDTLFENPFTTSKSVPIRWSPDSQEFYFDYNQRGHQIYRIIGVNSRTGITRVVVEERSTTFIDYTKKTGRHWLDRTGELLWMSERDGWTHLWLYDVKTGNVKKQLTRGPWVVRRIEHVDEAARQVWFMACGLRPEEDPCQQHLCRVNLDGSGFVQLTQGDGDHEVQFSPDRRYFVDEWSRADAAPVTELRRSASGELLCVLEQAEIGALLAEDWSLPERFSAKGRDGRTEIHGVIIKPSNFDEHKRYPVVELVYAGPHDAFAPKRFGRMILEHQVAEMGLIVVHADGMGTNHRGKAFHDVCWKNLKDAGFPDRIAWIKAAAAERPWMDLTRVGIFGGSAGGQNAMRALLDHHDFYQVAVADCGCHDNRMDKMWWNEQWLGWPVDEAYALNSNVEDAAKLQGRLLLIVGELDTNVDPASTMQAVAALQRAGKSFDFMPIAGAGHGAAETEFGWRLRLEFLVKHLLGSPP